MRLVQAGNRYVLYSEYSEREHPKRAGFRWEPKEKVWYTTEREKAIRLVSAADESLKAQLLGLGEQYKASVEASRAIDADIYIPAPNGLNYLNYQRAGVQYAVDRWVVSKREGWDVCGVLFGDDMGLGKTIQGIGWINADEEIKRVLVICPASLKLNWYKEIRKWLVRDRPVAVIGDKYPHGFDIVITNYDQLKKWELHLRRQTWDLLILDEGHYIKNPDTQRAQYIIGRKQRKEMKRKDGQMIESIKPAISPIPARRIAVLTGTPINNRPEELWTIAHLLDSRTFNDKWEYLGRYCGREKTRFGWKTDGASNLNELQAKLRSTIMVRRLKKDVLTELPPKRRQVIEMSPDQDTSLRALVSEEVESFQRHEDTLEALRAAVEIAKASEDVEEYRNAVRALREGLSASFAEMARLRKETALAKVPYVIGHLKDCLENGKVVCFCHHREVIDKIVAAFPGRTVKIDGRDDIKKRDEAVTQFQTNPKIDLFVGQIQAAGVGLTLVASSHVVFAELDWVPANLSQAEDRCHRIGQHDSVLAQHIVLEGSLDAKMATKLVAKQEVIDLALDVDAKEIGHEVVLPWEDKHATAGSTRASIAKEAVLITMFQIEAVHRALKILSGVCDGARREDGAGFNKLDSQLGKDLAGRAHLTAKQAALGRRICTKYKKQLGDDLVAEMWGDRVEENAAA